MDGYDYDLGDYSSKITTSSEAAQVWFDRGLTWVYGFNHEEAIVCFQEALKADPSCALAYWGVAYAIGPNYNKAWEMFEPAEREQALATAHQAIADGLALENCTDAERALLTALHQRYPTDPTIDDFDPFNDAFAGHPIKVRRNREYHIHERLLNLLVDEVPELGEKQG